MTVVSKRTTKTELKAHEFADIMPMMTDAEYKKLCEDIADVGLQEPILLYEEKILDGRNRYKACLEVGVEPKTVEFQGTRDQALTRVVSANLQRRNLTPSQRAALAVRLLPQVREEVHKARSQKLSAIAKARAGKAAEPGKGQQGAILPTGETDKKIRVRQLVANMVGVADRLVSDAQLLEEKNPKALEEVKAGKTTLNAALKDYRKDEAKGSGKVIRINYAGARRSLAAVKRSLGDDRELLQLVDGLDAKLAAKEGAARKAAADAKAAKKREAEAARAAKKQKAAEEKAARKQQAEAARAEKKAQAAAEKAKKREAAKKEQARKGGKKIKPPAKADPRSVKGQSDHRRGDGMNIGLVRGTRRS